MSLDILVLALAGYLFLRYTHLMWFSAVRESGYHLVFRSALLGLGFYAAGWALAAELGVPDFVEALKGEQEQLEEPQEGLGFDALLWMFGVAVVTMAVCNLVYGRAKAERRAALVSEDRLARLVDEAGQEGETIELSLKDGKTYIGYVLRGPIRKHGGEETAVEILPVLSGYRTRHTQELVLTTGYAAALERVEEPRKLVVVIPRAEICRARLFDIKLYRKEDFGMPWGDEGPPAATGSGATAAS